jgi:ABC-type uncharacterized transport system permease subunit
MGIRWLLLLEEEKEDEEEEEEEEAAVVVVVVVVVVIVVVLTAILSSRSGSRCRSFPSVRNICEASTSDSVACQLLTSLHIVHPLIFKKSAAAVYDCFWESCVTQY